VLYNDVAGPTRNTGFQGSVARHFAMDKEGKRWFSFGMSLQMFQFKFDVDRLQTDIPNDPAVQALARQNSRLSPDMSAGIYLNDENGFIGLSCSNMIQTKADIFKVGNNVNTVQRAYYLLAGYRFAASAQVVVEPVGLLKVTEAASWQADIMVRGIFNSNYWAGLSYRSGDAVSVLFGLRADMISFSYSYDYPVSKIGSFNTGTHEITAGVHIFNASSRYGTLQKPKGKDPLRNQPYKRFRRIP
jgi:type IX secretion system PorP/SprF family membrane protein